MTNYTGAQYILFHYFLYDYSLSDILINYTLIILFTFINNFYHQDVNRSLANIHSVIFLLLQVLCWLLLDAYGVSLVWSGQLGLSLLLLLDRVRVTVSPLLISLASLLQARSKDKRTDHTSVVVRALSGLAGFLAIMYYAYW